MNRQNSVLAISAALALSALVASAFAQEKNPYLDAYFGETHVHTSWSVDAWLFGNRITGPADAYKYFKGETIKHPLGYEIKIETPLDFAGVTDHSECVGVIKLANDPSSPISKVPAAQPLAIVEYLRHSPDARNLGVELPPEEVHVSAPGSVVPVLPQ